MATWTTVVLTVLSEYHNKDGVLKHKWEITRLESDEGKHFSPGLQKTSFYMKNGEQKRGYPQPLTEYDMKFIRDNWDKIIAAMNPAPATTAASPAPTPAAAPMPPAAANDDEEPF